jgi:hypothetical protein
MVSLGDCAWREIGKMCYSDEGRVFYLVEKNQHHISCK